MVDYPKKLGLVGWLSIIVSIIVVTIVFVTRFTNSEMTETQLFLNFIWRWVVCAVVASVPYSVPYVFNRLMERYGKRDVCKHGDSLGQGCVLCYWEKTYPKK